MRAALVALVCVGCGRLNFGYPVVPCEEVASNASALSSETEHCYTRHDVSTEHALAQKSCAALGGHLVTISSAEENDEIVRTLSLTGPVRIGLTNYVAAPTVWTWVTSEPATFANWVAGHPTDCANQGESALLTPDGTWISDCAVQGYPFLCEIEPWHVRDADQHAYRVVWDNQNWFNAQATCEAFGAHLAVLTDMQERAFAATVTTHEVWLGARSPGGMAFEWVSGEAFGSVPWLPGNPDLVGEACVLWPVDRAVNDFICSHEILAMCERE